MCRSDLAGYGIIMPDIVSHTVGEVHAPDEAHEPPLVSARDLRVGHDGLLMSTGYSIMKPDIVSLTWWWVNTGSIWLFSTSPPSLTPSPCLGTLATIT